MTRLALALVATAVFVVGRWVRRRSGTQRPPLPDTDTYTEHDGTQWTYIRWVDPSTNPSFAN